MAILGTILMVVAGLAMLVFSVQILITAFQTSVGWGLASLLIPFAILVFVFKHWPETKTPFLRTLACLPVYLIGMGLMMAGAMSGASAP
jgi:uncharacterized membrane protein